MCEIRGVVRLSWIWTHCCVDLLLSICLCLHRVSVLVLSSCYMAFKIVVLEHRLNSLVSIGA